MYSISEVSNGVNESNSKDQCDEKWEKCGFFGTRDVSEITKSNGSTFTYVLRGVLIPSVGILGLIGNTLSIIIFNRPEMKIWNSNGSYEMTKTSFIIKGKKYFIKDRRKSTYSTYTLQSGLLKFMFSEKATKIDQIFNVNLTFIK